MAQLFVENLALTDRGDTLKSANFTAIDGEMYLVDCSGGAITVSPPASPAYGMTFAVVDQGANAGLNNITVDLSGQLFHGAAADYVISTNSEWAKFVYINSTIGWIKVN